MRNGEYEMIIAPDGYPGKRYRGRYAYEHIVVFWRHTGRMPKRGHVVHHKNEHKRDNKWSNLEEKEEGKHKGDHFRIDPVVVVCGWCEENFSLKPSRYRTRVKHSASGLLFCSRSHQVKRQHADRT